MRRSQVAGAAQGNTRTLKADGAARGSHRLRPPRPARDNLSRHAGLTRKNCNAHVRHHQLRHHQISPRVAFAEAGWQTLLNRRGTTWKKLAPEKQAAVTDAATAIAVMLENPTAIRRPVMETDAGLIVGFDRETWEQAFPGH